MTKALSHRSCCCPHCPAPHSRLISFCAGGCTLHNLYVLHYCHAFLPLLFGSHTLMCRVLFPHPPCAFHSSPSLTTNSLLELVSPGPRGGCGGVVGGGQHTGSPRPPPPPPPLSPPSPRCAASALPAAPPRRPPPPARCSSTPPQQRRSRCPAAFASTSPLTGTCCPAPRGALWRNGNPGKPTGGLAGVLGFPARACPHHTIFIIFMP